MFKIEFFKSESDKELNDAILEKRKGVNSYTATNFLREEKDLDVLSGGDLYRKYRVGFSQIFNYLESADVTKIQNFFRTAFHDKSFRDLYMKKENLTVEEIWGNCKEYSGEKTIQEFEEKGLPGHLSVDFFDYDKEKLHNFSQEELVMSVIAYEQGIRKAIEGRLNDIEKWNEEFVSDVKNFSTKYDVLFEKDRIQQRINSLKYDLFDDFHAITQYGDYNPDTHMVRGMISNNFSSIKLTHRHELLHAISGTRNVMWILEHSYAKKIATGRAATRIGAAMGSRSIHKRFTWLNEAITEQFNLDLSDMALESRDDEQIDSRLSLFYEDERELFKTLLSAGKKEIEAKHFYSAFLETDNEEKVLPFREKLFAEIKDSYGNISFLVKLDDLVDQKGNVEAMKLLKEGGVDLIERTWSELYQGIGSWHIKENRNNK